MSASTQESDGADGKRPITDETVVRDTAVSTSNGGQHATNVDNVATAFGGSPQITRANSGPDNAPSTVDDEIGMDVLRRARRAARPPRAGSPAPQTPRHVPLLDPADPAAPEPVATSRRKRRRPRPGPREDTWSGAGPHSRDPQALGSVAAGMFAQRGWDRTLSESRVLGDWAAVVGPDVASQSTPISLRDGELRISASSTAWATQLRLLAPTLLATISEQVGAGVVTSLAISGPTAPSWKHGARVFRGRGPRDTYG